MLHGYIIMISLTKYCPQQTVYRGVNIFPDVDIGDISVSNGSLVIRPLIYHGTDWSDFTDRRKWTTIPTDLNLDATPRFKLNLRHDSK